MLLWIIASKFRAFLAVCLSLGIGAYIGFLFGHWDGVGDGENIQKLGQYEKALEVTEKRNEIRNHRPDTDNFFEQLWSKSDW